MKLRKVLSALIGCAVAAGAFVLPASAADEVWLKVDKRFSDYTGIDVKLAELIKIPADPSAGSYEFTVVVKPLNEGESAAFKILTQGGSEPPAYKRFTPRPKIDEEITLVTRMNPGETLEEPGSGKISSADIIAAADAEQLMRICTQSDTTSFIIKSLVVTMGDEVIYDMQNDATLLALNDGDEFPEEGTDILQKSGSPTITIAKQTVADTATETTETAETAAAAPAAGSTTNAPAATKGSADTGVADVAAIVGLAIIASGAVAISRKRK